MTDHSIEWLAGFFEGEGSISARISPSTELACGVPSVNVKVAVETTVESEPRAFHDYFGIGSVRKKPVRGNSRKPTYVWDLNDGDSMQFLQEMVDYLHGPKKEQAELAIDLLSGLNFQKGGNVQRVSEDEARRRISLANQIRGVA